MNRRFDAYVNIAGGIKMNEPAIDLGLVMAIVSSYKNKPIPEEMIVFGEVGLSGEVRAVTMPEQRVAEAKKLGFKTCVIPEVSVKLVEEEMIVFGEVGLSGEVRAVTMPEQRVAEAKKLGFKTCVIPEVSVKLVEKIEGIEIVGVKNVNEAMSLI